MGRFWSALKEPMDLPTWQVLAMALLLIFDGIEGQHNGWLYVIAVGIGAGMSLGPRIWGRR